MRVSALQIWPLLDRLAERTPAATVAGSASSRMMAADLPPSSRLTLVRLAAHAAATALPTAVDPVKETLSIPGWLTRCAPTVWSPGSTDTTPGGSPTSSNSFTRNSASNEVSGAGFTMTAQPASSAGTSLAMVRNCGMFHGTIAATTPTGSLRTWISAPKKPDRTSCQS